jgi:predicted NAD-dependent protein-ADP-ribosyltransferase YbiA (DUF1768 family)
MADDARSVLGGETGVLQFALNSRNVPMGAGRGERVRSADPADDAEFMALGGRGGRSVLSNMFPAEITVDLAGVLFPGTAFAAAHGGERRYASVEHAFQAAKGYVVLEAGGDVLDALRAFEASAAPAAEMRRLGGKRGPFAMDARLAAEWDAASYRVMEAACAAKAAHAEFRRALALTGNRVLVHQVRGHADVRLSRILHALRAGLSV